MTRTMRFWMNCEHEVRTSLLKIDGMEGPRSAGARLASVRSGKPGAFEWKRFLLERLL